MKKNTNFNYKLGNVEVTIISPELSIEDEKKNLQELYDVVREIAKTRIKSRADYKDWFYTSTELKKIKENPEWTKI